MAALSEALEIAQRLCQAGRLDVAEEIYRRVLQADSLHCQAWNDLGNALQVQGKLQDAVACYQRALGLKPDYVQAHNNLGIALRRLGRPDEAVACYRRALQIRPRDADIYSNLGNVLGDQGETDEAIACYRQAVALEPDVPAFLCNLAKLLHVVPEPEEAAACYRRALELDPQLSTVRSDYLCVLRYDPDVTLAELSAAQADYQRQHAAPLQAAKVAHRNSREPERRLRLGFVAPAFVRVPLGAFLIRALEHLDRRECQLVCYSGASRTDPFTPRFQAAAELWRVIDGMTDEQLAQQIRDDDIDILFDLAGHAPMNRLLVFARKPAPIQITWLDSVGSTGLSAMDYVLADRCTIPSPAEPFCVGKVLRMPDGYVAFEPPSDTPPVGPLPAVREGHLTFGSFNNPAKIHRRVVELWSRILNRVPGSRIVLKYDGLQLPASRRHFERQFAEFGVAKERVEMLGHSHYGEYLGQYARIDLALDPFPHGGGLTTCDSLWMGVPVVTCPGETFASRQTLSHLSNVGLTETVATNFDEYVDVAVGLARDLPRLAQIRSGLRSQMARSPLCDGKRFAENLMLLLRDVWRRWVQSGGR
jgi:predicted O-linked N-acetylglucosamine transferase (SPINDLY family)